MSSPNPVTLRLTEASRELLRIWPKLKKQQVQIIRSRWLTRYGAWMLREETKSFDDQKQPGSNTKWPENSDLTKDYKLSQGYGTLTNVMTGKMKGSISMDKGQDSVRTGSPLDYSIFTQDRADPRMNRPFLPEFDYAEAYAIDLGARIVREVV